MSWWLVFMALFPVPGDSPPPQREVVVVTGAYEPVPLEEADRAVRVFPLDAADRLLSNSVADFLRLDPSVDLQSRSPNGVQGDLSIRGGSFGQTLVLLDGLRLNDAQSGHHNLDIPVPPDVISRIEVLRGSGSAWYGSDAVGGVVNVITRVPEAGEFRLRGGFGNFGVNQQSGTAAATWRNLSQQFSFARDFSSGFAPDRDYRNLSLASVTHARSRLGSTALLLASTDRPFGADGFYGNFNSWERTRTWFAAARQELGKHTEVDFAFRRHTDLFVLYRDRPQVYTNRHAVESAQAALRRRETLRPTVTVSYGAEGFRDAIESTNLGHHQRNRGAAYAALDVRVLRRFSFSAAAREEVYSGGQRQFSPTAGVGYWATSHVKLRAGVSHAFRVPSYTELYYHDPANIGSPDLRPEKAWNYEGGLDWNAGRVRGDLTVFERRERDGIDYVRTSSTDIWRAVNFDRLHFTGAETSLAVKLTGAQTLEFRYSALRGVQDAFPGVYSKYVFNYPVHSALAAWQGTLPGGLIARTRLDALVRRGRDPYPVWDVYLAWPRGRLHPFLQGTNLTGSKYQEIQGVPMPGRGLMGGVEIVLLGKK